MIAEVIERDDVKRYLADPHFLAHLQLLGIYTNVKLHREGERGRESVRVT